MLETLPHKLRAYGLDSDVRTLLIMYKGMQKGLVRTLGDLYGLLKGLVVKDPRMLGPFSKAFYDYFLNIDIANGETLNDAILRSKTFEEWRVALFERDKTAMDLTDNELIDLFLNEVHLTSYDIKALIDGRALWDADNPELEDENPQETSAERRVLDKMADYSDLSLEELLNRMNEVMDRQKGEHSGGSHWIGTGGISPYGHGGAAQGGIRVGGTGGGGMARKVIGSSHFFPVDMDRIINDDNVDAVLASLRGVIEESAHEKLDVESTINKGLKRGGLFIPEIKNISEQKLRVLLLIDNGGYSMTPYIKTIRELFKKMKTRFSHDLETYYFHNTIYDRVFEDSRRSKPVFLDKILSKDPEYRVFIIGDASMAPYELNKMSLRTYKKLTKKFKRLVWLNPEPQRYWRHTYTLNVIRQVLEMFPLTPRGIEQAVRKMNTFR